MRLDFQKQLQYLWAKFRKDLRSIQVDFFGPWRVFIIKCKTLWYQWNSLTLVSNKLSLSMSKKAFNTSRGGTSENKWHSQPINEKPNTVPHMSIISKPICIIYLEEQRGFSRNHLYIVKEEWITYSLQRKTVLLKQTWRLEETGLLSVSLC